MSVTARISIAAVLVFVASCSGDTARASGMRVVTANDLVREVRSRAGQPLLLNFWATWCAPCVAELPDLQVVTPEFRAAGGEVVVLAAELLGPYERDERLPKAQRYMTTEGYDFVSWFYDESSLFAFLDQLELPETPDADAIPLTLAIDKSGAVVAVHLGQASRDEFRALCDRALAK